MQIQSILLGVLLMTFVVLSSVDGADKDNNNSESTKMDGSGPAMPVPALTAAAEGESGQVPVKNATAVPRQKNAGSISTANATSPTDVPSNTTGLEFQGPLNTSQSDNEIHVIKTKTRIRSSAKKPRKARKLVEQVNQLLGLIQGGVAPDLNDASDVSEKGNASTTLNTTIAPIKNRSNRPMPKYVTPVVCSPFPNCGSPIVPWYLSDPSSRAVSRDERRQLINNLKSQSSTVQSPCGDGKTKCGGPDGQMCTAGCRCASGLSGGMGSGSALQLVGNVGNQRGFCSADSSTAKKLR